jgi:PPK2 family polyphosphate:nucleotide phosphotransferase
MDQFRVPSPGEFRLSDYAPGDTRGMDDAVSERTLEENRPIIAELQNVLYAEKKHSLLIVLQSMDTGGKDPIIRDVLDGVNSQGTRVTHFKRAKGEEERHDRYWRFHKAMPMRGEIGVFNRSYYDDTIREDAHGDLPDSDRASHYRQFNLFEELLSASGISVIKIFLHISKDEQRRRLQERIDNPSRHWELSESDFAERKYWDGYMRAYESLIRATHKDHAPWFLIPADNKMFRDAAASAIFRAALERLDPHYPPPKIDLSKIEWH